MTRWLAICIFALIAVDLAHGDEWRCPHSNVVIHLADRGDADAACGSARNALDFLAANGLDTTGAVEVHLVSELPMSCLRSNFGCYDHPNWRIYMLIFSECLKLKTWAELPLNSTLCNSLLTHEVAHAVAAANFLVPKPSMLAHEYVAYVTMLATMPSNQRERVLEQFPGEGFDSANQMSVTFYLLNPFQFGINAYRHFLKPGNGKVFLKDLLSGRVLIDKDER
jgi:hypothetical protein